jgi:hypothetical protein
MVLTSHASLSSRHLNNSLGCDQHHIADDHDNHTLWRDGRNTGVRVLRPAFWRCVRELEVLLLVVLCAGHASGETPMGCPTSPGAGTSVASSTRTAPIARETLVWKTITVGGSKGVNAVRKAMETTPRPIEIGDDADEILGRPAFPFIKKPVELDLVVLSIFELGFGDQDARNDVELGTSAGVSLHDIYARALSLGFELCPAEVGPALRLQYLDQPNGEFLQIAMNPVARYTGELIRFRVARAGAGLLLLGSDGDPATTVPGAFRFVFVRPRPDTIVRGTPRVSGLQ